MVKTIKLALAAATLTSMTAIAIAQTTPAPTVPTAPAAPEASQPAAPSANNDDRDDGPRMGRRMARMDANNDGSISQNEFVQSSRAMRMKQADANSDGELSQDEMIAMLQKRDYERQAEQMTRRMDIDGDGKVTIAEIEQHRGKRFALLDRNNDGKLEGRELRRGGQFGGQDRREGRRWERGERRHDRGDWHKGHGRHHGQEFDQRGGDMDDDGPSEL